MELPQILLVAIALATYNLWQLAITGYSRLPNKFFSEKDIFGRRHYGRLKRIRKRFGSTWTIPVALTAVSLALTPWWNWEAVDPHYLIRPVILAASGFMTWRAITVDVELATGTSYPLQRALIVLAWIGVWFQPGFLILLRVPVLPLAVNRLLCLFLVLPFFWILELFILGAGRERTEAGDQDCSQDTPSDSVGHDNAPLFSRVTPHLKSPRFCGCGYG